jgi:hypothetical protein
MENHMGAKITLMGPEWISLDGSLPEVQKPCYFLDRENVFRGVMDEQGDVYEILDNGTNDVVYHSNIEDGYIAFWKQELKMIENMEDKDISDKTRMKGMNQGIWLAVQELAHDGRWTQAAEELVSSCGLTEDECRELQEESGSFNDEMLDFINSVFGHEDMINNSITLENIGYHKIGSIFKYNIGSKEVELEVVESSDASCEGCVFNNSKNYYCKDTHCIDVDRKDDIDVIYKEVKRS